MGLLARSSKSVPWENDLWSLHYKVWKEGKKTVMIFFEQGETEFICEEIIGVILYYKITIIT